MPPFSLCRLTFITIAPLLAVTTSIHAQETIEGPLPSPRQSQSPPSTTAPTASPTPGALDNAAIIRMTRAEVGDAIILATIRSQPSTYRTGPDDLIALKNANVSESVIAAILAQNSGLAQHPAPNPIEVTPLSAEVDDPGVYFKNKQGQWEPVSPELVKYRDGGALKSVFTNNVVKKDRNGVVAGPRSTLVLATGTEMMIVAPRQADPVEYQVLRFRPHADRREFRIQTGNVFHSETGTDRDQLTIPIRKVSSRIFAFTVPADLTKGEYGVLPPGSASTPGISYAGKMYTFTIRE